MDSFLSRFFTQSKTLVSVNNPLIATDKILKPRRGYAFMGKSIKNLQEEKI
jgi:hypothetical protein